MICVVLLLSTVLYADRLPNQLPQESSENTPFFSPQMACIPCQGPGPDLEAEYSKVTSNRPLKNWGRSYQFTPAIVVEATTFEDVIEAVQDTEKYPTPVRALGNIHTVTEAVVNEGGTVVLMRKLNQIIAVGNDDEGQTVTAQAGTTLLELHNWLGKKGLEMLVAPEIGDASVGSIVGSVTKDAGPGPSSETGSLYKAIVGVKYVDHMGRVVRLSKKEHAADLGLFKCSEGLLGIVLEVTFRIFPESLVQLSLKIMKTKDMVKKISTDILSKTRTAFILVQPELSFIETREPAPVGAEASSEFWWSLIAAFKLPNFQHGLVLFPFPFLKFLPYRACLYRRTQVNHYGEPGPRDNRLDFSWYEYPFERFEEVVTAFNAFTLDFAERHNGWRPGACATYFMERMTDKPHGWFSCKGKGYEKAGMSFTLDPIFNNPNDPNWRAFVKECNVFAVAHGGRVALTQTREMDRDTYLACPGQVPLKEAPNKRFTTPFFARFVEREGEDIEIPL
jgi:UDP-N-acetylenolpyruvoylglucosamine reductase